MEVEKRGSKGGFFHLFEWNSKSKSRKKLFSTKSDIHEESKQGTCHVDSLVELDDEITGTDLSYRTGNDSNKDLSMSSDEGYGSRAPGVVARLMGLDHMPSSTVCEPSTTFLDSSTIRYPPYSKTSHEFIGDHQIREYNIMSNEFEAFRRNPGKTRPQKAHAQPLERFQTEVLPPKSAKSIPITRHKLLSPIKSPAFIPKKSAAYVMEAAAKFIELSPQANVKGKRPSFGSSSVPLRVQDLTEKMEAAQKLPHPEKPKDPSAVRNTGLKNKTKPVSLALQAKVNVQRREGLKSSSNRSSAYQKDLGEVNSNCISKSQLVTDKRAQKTNTRKKNSSMLRQNNQKQNSIPSKDRITIRTPGSCQQARTDVHVNASSRLRKTVSTVVVSSESGSKKVGSVKTDTENEHSSSKANFSRKKRLINRDTHYTESVEDNRLICRDKTSVQCPIAIDKSINQEVDKRKKNMDIVSFTFSSPIKGSMSTSLSSSEVKEQNSDLVNSYDGEVSKLSFQGFSTVTGDALSVLLEHKLRELTCKVENSNLIQAGSSSSASCILQDQISSFDVVSTIPVGLQNGHQLSSKGNKSDGLFDDADKWQDFQMEEQCSCSYTKAETNPPIADSTAEPSLSSGSYYLSGNEKTDCITGSKKFSLIQSEEAIDQISTGNSRSPKWDAELCDSASSLPSWDLDNRKRITTFNDAVDNETPTNWELEYVSSIVHTADLSCKDFALGKTCRVLKPSIFDQLENQKHRTEGSRVADYSRLDRKVWFDCVSECLDLRFQRFPGGGCTSLAKWVTLFQTKGPFAEELYKEILVWRSSGELMVDEVVDKDMSTGHGKWLDFETEAFEEGLDLEDSILSYLVDEIVDGFFFP